MAYQRPHIDLGWLAQLYGHLDQTKTAPNPHYGSEPGQVPFDYYNRAPRNTPPPEILVQQPFVGGFQASQLNNQFLSQQYGADLENNRRVQLEKELYALRQQNQQTEQDRLDRLRGEAYLSALHNQGIPWTELERLYGMDYARAGRIGQAEYGNYLQTGGTVAGIPQARATGALAENNRLGAEYDRPYLEEQSRLTNENELNQLGARNYLTSLPQFNQAYAQDQLANMALSTTNLRNAGTMRVGQGDYMMVPPTRDLVGGSIQSPGMTITGPQTSYIEQQVPRYMQVGDQRIQTGTDSLRIPQNTPAQVRITLTEEEARQRLSTGATGGTAGKIIPSPSPFLANQRGQQLMQKDLGYTKRTSVKPASENSFLAEPVNELTGVEKDQARVQDLLTKREQNQGRLSISELLELQRLQHNLSFYRR